MPQQAKRCGGMKTKDWEAGANPALPRNCKREFCDSATVALPWEGRSPNQASLSQETGANRQPPPLSRAKEAHVPRLRAVLYLLLIPSISFSADWKIKVVDPRAAVVIGARIALYPGGKAGARAIALQETGPEGLATFSGLSPGLYRIEVMAPGFASRRLLTKLEQPSAAILLDTVALQPAPAAYNIVVTAAATPLPAAESGAGVATLERNTLIAMQPVESAEAIRFLPGAVINVAGRRGGLASLFVRGGESRYNKVIVDGVALNDPGGTFDFGVVPMTEVDRLEFVRGAESTLYGSDAMTSVVQLWTRTGSTLTPELCFGADGGSFSSARGYASLAGSRGHFDYDLFAEQFNTAGQGVNDDFSNSSQGANVGVLLAPKAIFRFRTRHSNNRSGVQSFWTFDGRPLVPPDSDQRARQNNFLASAELTLAGPAGLQHRLTGFEYNHRRTNIDSVIDPGRVSPLFGNFDFPFSDLANINRAGLEYQGEYWEHSGPPLTSRTIFGYHFEDENGFVGDLTSPPLSHGLRRNHAGFVEQLLNWRQLSLIAGVRFLDNESFGYRTIPRVALTLPLNIWTRSAHPDWLSGTSLRFAYGAGIKEPRLEESFGQGGFGIIPNPGLKPEEVRSLEAAAQQAFLGGRYFLSGAYFNNLFRNQIAFSFDPLTFISQYVNVNRALAHGAELGFHARPGFLHDRLTVQSGYTYTSTQILKAPLAFDPLLAAGAPLLRRPRHSGNLLLTYAANRWGGNLGASFVGRRADSDFLGLFPPVTHAAGYARLDLGGWYALTSRITGYLNLENALNQRYEEAAGYPALKANLRAGLRFRIGGE